MRAHVAYLDTLERQLAAMWLNSSADVLDKGVPLAPSAVSEAAMARCMREHLHRYGGTASAATPGHVLPATGPTLMDVIAIAMRLLDSLESPTAPFYCRTLWAPSVQECLAAGCEHLPSSRLLVPANNVVSRDILRAVSEWFPDELRVRASDSRASLLERISTCAALDDLDAPVCSKKRRGCAARRLNDTPLPQPRRATFSVQASPVHTVMHSGHAAPVVNLYHYYGFKHARVMPNAIFDLGTAVWRACFQVLSAVSRVCPFTHCQLLLYYECFGCRINQHRDNSNTRILTKLLSKLEAGESDMSELDYSLTNERGQVAGSNVVIFTLGSAPMQMLLRFPHAQSRHENREDYVIHPTFSFTLDVGTIFVWDPIDDIYFTHEAFFECEVDASSPVGESGWREAYVFRHVDMLSAFNCAAADHSLLFTSRHAAIEDERKRVQRKRVARQRAEMSKCI